MELGNRMCVMHPSRIALSVAQRGRQLALEKIKEIVLMWSHLQQDDVIVASIYVAADRLEVTIC
jgi:hypothetical protein